jgi:hypothetical protein
MRALSFMSLLSERLAVHGPHTWGSCAFVKLFGSVGAYSGTITRVRNEEKAYHGFRDVSGAAYTLRKTSLYSTVHPQIYMSDIEI